MDNEYTLRLNIVTLMVLSMNVKTLRWSYKQQLVKWGLWSHSNCCCIKTGHVKVNFHNGNEFIADDLLSKTTSIINYRPNGRTCEIDVERAKLAKSRASHLEEDDDTYRHK